MKILRTPTLLLALSLGCLSSAPFANGAQNGSLSYRGGFDRGRGFDYGEIRGLVDRTQSDLRVAAELEHGDKQRGRYQHAQDDLSKFDRKLTRSKFDKGSLEHALSQLKSIIDHNTLQPSTRDALLRDLSDLKVARDRR